MNLSHRIGRRLPRVALGTLLALALAAPAARALETLDRGSYVISLNGRGVGRENFDFLATGDSLVVNATSDFTLPGRDGERKVKKLMSVVFGRDDMMLRGYQSNEEFDGHLRIRGVVMGSEIAMTLIRELDGQGTGDAVARPPGRVFVLESQLYTLMHVIAYAVRGQSFDRRPVNLVVLAERDTVQEVELVRLPAQTIRWGSRPVQADHLQFVQGSLAIDLWVDRLGRLLRLEHVPTGLRVEREAQKVKPRSSAPKGGG